MNLFCLSILSKFDPVFQDLEIFVKAIKTRNFEGFRGSSLDRETLMLL
jgi:hypothetical protein